MSFSRIAAASILTALVTPALAESPAVQQSARDLPVAYTVDVLVVGGGTGVVAAAASAARQGAKVFLAAPHPYLGDDMTATLRLWLEPGETPQSALAKRVYTDPNRNGPRPDPDRLALTYQANRPSSGVHKDTNPPSRLTDGLWGDATSQSVQYDGDVTITADLGKTQPVRGLRVIYYHREGGPKGSFQVESVGVSASDDGQAWRPLASLKHGEPSQCTDFNFENCFALNTAVAAEARYVKFDVKKSAVAERVLLGEIEILGPPSRSAAVVANPPVRPMHVKRVLDDVLLESGVTYLYGCYATDVLQNNQGQPCGIIMANRAGRQVVLAKTIVDATDRALVARLAGGRFRPYPAGLHTLHRVVIGGEVHAAEHMTHRTIDPPYHGLISPAVMHAKASKAGGKPEQRPAAAPTPGVFAIHEYTLQLPMSDAGPAAWAAAEQQARTLTYDPDQNFTSDDLFELPPDPMFGQASSEGPWPGAERLPLAVLQPAGVGRLWVLGGCADVSREQAQKLVRPLAQMDLGERVGRAAAEEAGRLAPPAGAHLPKTTAKAAKAGEIREFTGGVRPVEKSPSLHVDAWPLPILGKYDVLVVGGGTGGVPAGIAAARQGARTLVVEYLHGLGGVGTAGAISSYCAGNRVGFTATVLAETPDFTRWRIEEKMEWWRSHLLKAGAELWCGTVGCGALVDHGQVRGVVVATPQGRGLIEADVVIDATGNADVAAAAGSASVYTGAGELAMQGTGLPPRQLGASYMNTDFTITDETDLVDVWHMLVYAKHKYPQAFDQGQLVDTRERRCIVGDYTLTITDEILHRTYPDTVVQTRGGSYDTHGYTVDPFLTVVHPNTGKLIVDIPYRTMLPKGLEGILVIGLGLSAHRDAIPMIRMQADVQNGGYAAGVAAAMAARAGSIPRHIDVRALQEHLVQVGNLSPEVIGQRDSFPLPAAEVAAAVARLHERPADLALVFAQPDQALPLLREAYAASPAERKPTYALVLAMLGDRTGAETLLDQVGRAQAWDQGWNFKAMGQFGNAFSPLDAQIVALGHAGDRRAVPLIAEKLRLLSATSEFSHYRAAALALELLRDPAAVGPLAEALRQPQIAGHAHHSINAAIADETPGGTNSEQTRRESLREIALARALFRCGDSDGLGEKTLKDYARDLRGHLARHAQAVLDEGKAGKK